MDASRQGRADRRRDRRSASGWPISAGICRSTWRPSCIGELTPALKRSPVPVVIDHMGRIDASLGLEQAPFRNLLALMDRQERLGEGERRRPRHAAGPALCRRGAVRAQAGRPNSATAASGAPTCRIPITTAPIPDDGVLVDLLAEIAPKPAQLQALLVDNPQRFYRFAPARSRPPRRQNHERTSAGQHRHRHRRRLRRPRLGQRPRHRACASPRKAPRFSRSTAISTASPRRSSG